MLRNSVLDYKTVILVVAALLIHLWMPWVFLWPEESGIPLGFGDGQGGSDSWLVLSHSIVAL